MKSGPPLKENALRRNAEYQLQRQRQWRANNPDLLKEQGKRSKATREERYRANPLGYLLMIAKSRAKKSDINFDINVEDLELPSICPILLEPIDILNSSYRYGASLDRVNNELGYVKGNVRVISRKANRLKGDATADQLLRVVAYMRGEL